jgi:iron complex outermembrane receptor protein
MIDKCFFPARSRIALAVAASLAAPVPAWAADATPEVAAADESAGLAEVVVTARKTKEELQITPVAVTAISAASLTSKQLVQVADLAQTVPGMATGTTGPGPSSVVYLSIRGEAQNNGNSASDQAVGTYVDGVYIARAIAGNLGFLDVANVEVLRGPQGTLFGRNTTGGALNITTKQPTGQLEGNIEVGSGNFGQIRTEGTLNVPLNGDELAVRVAARYVSHNAYFNNPISAVGADKLRYDGTGHVTLRWAPSSLPLSATLSVDRTTLRDTGTAQTLLGYNAPYLNSLIPGVPLATLIPVVTGLNPANYLKTHDNFWTTYVDPKSPEAIENTPFSSNKAGGAALNLDADLGPVHAKSITGYRDSRTANAQDLDSTPVNLGSFNTQFLQHQLSEELQLSGTVDKFDLIGGLYYFKEGGFEQSHSDTFQVISDIFKVLDSPLFPDQPVNADLAAFSARSRAAFFQTNYHITDTVRFTAGYRYTKDDRAINRHGHNDILGTNTCGVGADFGNLPGQPCNDPHSATFSYPAYTFSLDWQALENTFLYAKTSRASLAGGFNTRPVPAIASDSFSPETNKDVELGIKNESLDKHLRTNLALFYSRQSNLQNLVNTIIPASAGQSARTTQYVANSGDARKYGAELEITAIPAQNLELQLTAAYLHAAYKPGSFTETQLVGGNPVVVDRSGEPILQAPKYTFSLGATRTLPVAVGEVVFHADYTYRASEYYMYQTPAPSLPPDVLAQYAIQNALNKTPAFGLLNARVSFTLNEPNLEFALWGRNLTERQYLTYEFNSYTGLGMVNGYQGDPRTYGATINYRF